MLRIKLALQKTGEESFLSNSNNNNSTKIQKTFDLSVALNNDYTFHNDLSRKRLVIQAHLFKE